MRRVKLRVGSEYYLLILSENSFFQVRLFTRHHNSVHLFDLSALARNNALT